MTFVQKAENIGTVLELGSKGTEAALASVAQLVGHHSADGKVLG